MSALEHPIRAKLPKLLAFGTEEKLSAWLREQHTEKKRSVNDIAKEIGCSPSRIMELLAKSGIPRIPDPDKPIKEKGASRPAEGDGKHFISTSKFKAIIAAVDEVLGSNRYKFERCDVIDSVTSIDAVWSASGMKATLSPHRTESGARSSINTLTFESNDASVKHVVRVSSPATEKIDRAAEKFMKLIIKSKNVRRAHVKAEDIKTPSKHITGEGGYTQSKNYHPFCWCESCRTMIRENMMHSKELCSDCYEEKKGKK